MIEIRFFVVQPQSGASAPAAPPTSQQLRDQISQQIREATEEGIRGSQEGVRASQEGMRGSIVRVGPNREIFIGPQGPPMPGVPGMHLPGPDRGGIPPEAVDMAMGFFVMCAVMVVGWPIARALGRRIERTAAAPAMEPQVSAHLHRIEQAVESMAIEVERISESQRFIAKLQSRSEERV